MKICPRCSNNLDSSKWLCKTCLPMYQHELYEKNKQQRADYGKVYRQLNKKSIARRDNAYKKNLRKTNPFYRLRKDLSRSIQRSLKSRGSSKNGRSIMHHLPYSFHELKSHIESQFEAWMSWDNQGIYKLDKWDDNDPTTWTWNIDHIIPQSDLPYTSMSDDNFQKCWALSNLRPLSSKQNVSEGASKIRHIMSS